MENKNGIDYPPVINHTEYYYGFIGTVIAWQIAFIIISRDPVRYKPIMPATIVEKVTFGVACIILFIQGKISTTLLTFGFIDLFLMCLFIFAYIKTPDFKNE